jgi:hypothetical protein
VSVNEVPPPLRAPTDIIVTPELSVQSTASTVPEMMLPPVPVVLEVTDALVNVTAPKLASASSVQLPLHEDGLSTITSAVAADAAESVITVEDVHPAVWSMTSSVHTSPDNCTDPVIASPGCTGYDDVESGTIQ